MSNCIRFKKPSEHVYFDADEINLAKLMTLMERVNGLPKAPDWEVDPEGYMAWWFLTDNTILDADRLDNGHLWIDGLVIWFGEGRSEHTNRDFKALCLMLNKYMLKDKEVRFWVYDEGDGFEECCNWDVKFELGHRYGLTGLCGN